MALRDQPYFPFYVQDYMTDEKLMDCSAEANGVYIRIMCLMHKSEPYGHILLKQKYKQSPKQVDCFALQLVKFLPYSIEEISRGLYELLDSGALSLEGDTLIQKRMVRDCELSEKRALAGSKGGRSTQDKSTQKFAKAKSEATAENEYEDDINMNNIKVEFEKFRIAYPHTKRGFDTEFENFRKKHRDWRIAVSLLYPALKKEKNWRKHQKGDGGFCPEWKHLQTWLNQRMWEQELPEITNSQHNDTPTTLRAD